MYGNDEEHTGQQLQYNCLLEIASNYWKKDSRIRVHSNSQFVGIIENTNIALGLYLLE